MDKKFTVALPEAEYQKMYKKILELAVLRGKKLSISDHVAALITADNKKEAK